MPGVQTQVTDILPFNETITITIEGKPIILGFSVARSVFVEKTNES